MSSGLDYGVTQVFSFRDANEGLLPHRERMTRSNAGVKNEMSHTHKYLIHCKYNDYTPVKRAASWQLVLQYS